MSHSPIAPKEAIQKLRDEGYDIGVVASHLVMRNVPYLKADISVGRGILFCPFEDTSIVPSTHTAHFSHKPHHPDGRAMSEIINSDTTHDIGGGIIGRCYLSAKPQPTEKYRDFYHKMITYAEIISGPARVVDPDATAQTSGVIDDGVEDDVFNYLDTASARAEITRVTAKLRGWRIAIVGMGGSGSYVLDYVAKTPVAEIHIFDGDRFLQHNAFRAPGAPTKDELARQPFKVAYFKRIYDRMRKGIFAHEVFLDDSSFHLLEGMDFVFLCMEGKGKRQVVSKLEQADIPFVDVGMGIYLVGGFLGGLLRTTTSTPDKRSHVHEKNRIGFAAGDDRNEYGRNIQIAELNALNAVFAVIRWKKLLGFYLDQEEEHHSVYAIGGNEITNEDLGSDEKARHPDFA